MTRLYVKPAEGRAVRDPERDNELVPPEGKFVPRSIYWLRRLAQGDVVEARPPKADKSGAKTGTAGKAAPATAMTKPED